MTKQPLARPAVHAWERLWIWWVAMLGLAMAVTAAAFAFADGIPLATRFGGFGLLAVIGFAYRYVGYPAMISRDGRRSALYLTVAIAAEAGLLAIHPAAFVVLFGLYPHCYAAFSRLRSGLLAGGVLSVVSAVASYGWAGWDRDALPEVVIQSGFSVAFGMLFAAWITKIIHESSGRADLIDELERTRSELAVTNRAAGIRSERDRVAAEIHDTLAQGFTSIVLLAEGAGARLGAAAPPELETIAATARDNLAEARALIAELQPVSLQHGTLEAAIRRQLDKLMAERPVLAELAVTGDARPLPADQEVALLRAAQEALTNIAKHASAHRVRVDLDYGSEVRLAVHDDGAGFAPDTRTAGFGLLGLRRRVEQVGGTFSVDSAPGQGTTVRVELA